MFMDSARARWGRADDHHELIVEYAQGIASRILFVKTVRWVSWMLTAGTLLAGLLLVSVGLVGFSWVFFVLFPIAVGFSTAIAAGSAGRKTVILALCIVGLVVFMALAVVMGMEGLVCVLMAMPLLLVALIMGALLGLACRNTIFTGLLEKERRLPVIAFPLVLLLVGDPIARQIDMAPPMSAISTTITLPQDPIDVFEALRSMDTLDGEQPWLLRIGLPTPYRCVLEAERVGAERKCLFPNGHITAVVTAYEPGTALRMKVVEYELTGRHWFHFGDADYAFERKGSGTRVTRTSSYRSDLQPRWYWAPLEKLGIEQEHEFVLRSLKKNLERAGH